MVKTLDAQHPEKKIKITLFAQFKMPIILVSFFSAKHKNQFVTGSRLDRRLSRPEQQEQRNFRLNCSIFYRSYFQFQTLLRSIV